MYWFSRLGKTYGPITKPCIIPAQTLIKNCQLILECSWPHNMGIFNRPDMSFTVISYTCSGKRGFIRPYNMFQKIDSSSVFTYVALIQKNWSCSDLLHYPQTLNCEIDENDMDEELKTISSDIGDYTLAQQLDHCHYKIHISNVTKWQIKI